MQKPITAGTIDAPMDAHNLVTIIAHPASDVGDRYSIASKPWVEHEALLAALPDLDEDEPQKVERGLE